MALNKHAESVIISLGTGCQQSGVSRIRFGVFDHFLELYLNLNALHKAKKRGTKGYYMKFAPGTFLSLLLPVFMGVYDLTHAQTPPAPAAPRNLIVNGGFENVNTKEFPWDGINRQGLLEVSRVGNSAKVLTASGSVGNAEMPASVSVGDLNGDGLQDLLVSSPIGYMYVYFNSGTKEQPKFGTAEIIPVFLSRPRNRGDLDETYRAQRVHLADTSRSGKLDIWVGNYIGEIFRIPNTGTGINPDFRQPRTVQELLIPTTAGSRRWGNVFAPALWDFNNDGRTDLLIGEGSYSANSIHILLNEGSNAQPKFSDTGRHVLAYGMGREQLTPAVVDYDADGNPDLLVTDRSGKIGIYSSSMPLSPQAAEEAKLAGIPPATGGKWKPGEHLPFVDFVRDERGREISGGGHATVAVGDLNGDGLFDIVLGKTNGRVAIAYNKGTKTAPQFAAPVEIKTELTGSDMFEPVSWDINAGFERGNFLGYATVVAEEIDPSAQPPENKRAFKFGYHPNPNKIIRSPFTWTGLVGNPSAPGEGDVFGRDSLPNLVGIRQRGYLDPEKTYVLSFKHKGSQLKSASVRFRFTSKVRFVQAKETRDERGRLIKREGGKEISGIGGDEKPVPLSVGSTWSEFKKEYKIVLDNPEFMNLLKDDEFRRNTRIEWEVLVAAELNPGSGTLYLDDFKLIEKQ
jgi:hypothetical protein